ncbi:shikimate 5-dehydrogenase [Pirellula staleyi DSM 6068]|uniref:Multifunctional fusion protein n=1 Tax=Pirellula staleyi (strain ATCC 27377 / DSM 6068 / ICPB 4128) TaxID=530564 RepID=D2R261_PIRSD|nr:shikimate dehydrogenase [Pirellula staleyi]ADB18672.1 shikimate 5-dehydrogenase [Pirellula staleyi DSM 6068]
MTICVIVGRGRHKHMIAEHKHLGEVGAQLVELRLDYIMSDVNLRRLLPERPTPVVITVRRQRDGGRWSRSEDQRQVLLRQAIASGVEYVDLEEDIAGSIPRFGKTKRIVSYHNFQETPENLAALHERMSKLDADIVKIATMAHTPSDTTRLVQLMKGAKIPTVAIAMGEIGTPSRILGGKFGSPLTYAAFSSDRELAPGQLSYEQMRAVYHYDDINADTEVFGVVADPVGHSMSPLLHNAAFRALSMNRVYLPLRVPREHLAKFLQDCPELGIKGLSVTIPHKEEVIQHLVKTDDATTEIAACNTVIWKEGKPVGYNTDYRASMASIDRLFGGDEKQSGLAGKTALLLGAGGVSKAIACGLRRRGCDVVIASRTLEKSEALAKKFKARTIDWKLRHSVQAHLVVNGTPLGMHPNLDESPIDEGYFSTDMVAFDTVYNPEQTLFIKRAREAGAKTITGIDMFVGQAALQFKLFTAHDPPMDLMRQTIRRAISAAKL